ncbi:hypothetical protein TrCOL_g5223 [Triparma columacea]|uniref:cDENN domain-containing protein n=1 Tax=Triparma columacea TaxID=722753 RepID=A0A9W7G467_9STRA|nr:hypothetical protein TrCOL_g5223 [Triparma columacea]
MDTTQVIVGSIVIRVGDEMDGFLLGKPPQDVTRAIAMAPAGTVITLFSPPSLPPLPTYVLLFDREHSKAFADFVGEEDSLKLFFLTKGFESTFENDTDLPPVEDYITKLGADYQAILNLTSSSNPPPSKYPPLEVPKTYFETPYLLCKVSKHGRIYHACTEGNVEIVWREVGWADYKLDVLVKSLAFAGGLQREVLVRSIKDICEAEIRSSWKDFLLSPRKYHRVLKVSALPSLEVEAEPPSPIVVGFLYSPITGGWSGQAFAKSSILPNHLPDYALPAVDIQTTSTTAGEFSYHLPLGSIVAIGFTKWSKTDDGTITVISVVNGDANSISVYEDWKTMVPRIISEVAPVLQDDQYDFTLPKPLPPLPADPMTSLIITIKRLPIRVLSSLFVATLHERPTFVFSHSRDRNFMFHVFTTLELLLRPLIYRHTRLSWCRSDVVAAMVDSPLPFMLGTDDSSILDCKETVVIDLSGSCGVRGRSYSSDDSMSFNLSRRNWSELNNTFHTKEERKSVSNQAKVFRMTANDFVKLQIGNREARRWRTHEGWEVDDYSLGDVKTTQSWICHYSDQ